MEFVFKGTLTLDGVEFYIKADTKEGALARAARGDFDSYNSDLAASTDWEIRVGSIEEN